MKVELLAATFEHSGSRENQPQLHTHMVLTNLCRGDDGKVRTIDGSAMYEWSRAAGALYHSYLSQGLEKRGYGIIERDVKHGFDVAGIPEELCDDWSERRKQILAETRANHPACNDIASMNSRKSKGEIDREVFFDVVQQEAKDKGYDIDAKKLKKGFKSKRNEYTTEEVVKTLSQQENVFTDANIFTEVAKHSQTVSHDKILERVELVKSDLLLLGKDEKKRQLFTTPEIIKREQSILEMAKERQGENPDLSADLSETIEEWKDGENGFSLLDEQKEVVKTMYGQDGIVCIQGWAGTGKSFSMKAVRAIGEEDYEFIGCAPSGKAAKGLEDGSGIKSDTVHALLVRISKAEKNMNVKQHGYQISELKSVSS